MFDGDVFLSFYFVNYHFVRALVRFSKEDCSLPYLIPDQVSAEFYLTLTNFPLGSSGNEDSPPV